MPQSGGKHWRKLDNAAKLFPAASSKKDTRVFRFFCELKEDVKEEVLQQALDKTLEKYPIYLSVMRKGLFWHYLEKSNKRPVVREEYKEPCSQLYIRDKSDLLFEVTYYKKRINFEVFHVLTDGTGASEFVRELVKNYLYLVHREDGLEDVVLSEYSESLADQESDGFEKYYSQKVKLKRVKKPVAHQLRKGRRELGSLQTTEAEIPVKDLKAKAKEYGVSMTVFLTAVYLCAVHRTMTRRQEEKPVILMVPVNLRQFFPINTMLNFFNWIEPGYQFKDGKEDFEDVLKAVQRCFKEELMTEKMEQRMSDYFALQVHPVLKFAPLELKNICINVGARTAEKDVTAIFSNMGIIKMPESYEPYIQRFGVFTSTPKVELCMCSFRDKIYLGFTSRYDCDHVKEAFFQILKEQSIGVEKLKPDYPEEVMTEAKGLKVFKIFTFLCILALVLALGIDFSIDRHFRLSLFVGGATASMWVALAMGFLKRHNLLKNAMWQLIIVTVGCLIWDRLTGWRGWSVDFVLPGVSVLVMLTMVLISRVYYKQPKDYVVYFVMASLYGLIIPFVCMAVGITKVTFPSVISIGVSVLMLVGLVLFRGKELRLEMEKNLHV